MKDKIAIIYTWPGSNVNAEVEVIRRFKVALDAISQPFDVISKEGHILDDQFKYTKQKITPDNYKFMLSLHYDDIKLLDIFSYHTLWNPPYILLQYQHYKKIIKQLLSNDDFLVYDDGGMSDHLASMLDTVSLDLMNASSLTASFPASVLLQPHFEDLRLFYCGINWEVLIGTEARHANFFSLLDTRSDVCLYGPSPGWKGYKSYMGTLPFDGFSLIEEVNKCGAYLALSSDYHYRAGAASNRIYEGIAAGAVVITDTNPFIKKHFGDSVLYIDFDKKNPSLMYEQVAEHMEWINSNKAQATDLVLQSQQIFLEKFALEKQFEKIIENHDVRLSVVAKALYSSDIEAKTLAILFVDSLTVDADVKATIVNVIQNIERQYEKNVTLLVACDEGCKRSIADLITGATINIVLRSYSFYDYVGYKVLTRGQAFLDILNNFSYDFLLVLDGTEHLFSTHITTLKRCLEDDVTSIAAHSGLLLESRDTFIYPVCEDVLKTEDIYAGKFLLDDRPCSGLFLMRARIKDYLANHYARYLDGAEIASLLNLAVIRHGEHLVFSRRLTCSFNEHFKMICQPAISFEQQHNFIKGLSVWEYAPEKVDRDSQEPAVTDLARVYLYKQLMKNIQRRKFRILLRLLITASKSKRKRLKLKYTELTHRFNECNRIRASLV